MTINDLRVLQLVAAQGSFAGAARILDVDPSSVSRTIAGIEETLGVRLFQRSTRRLSVTDAGEIFLQRLAPLLDGLEEARDAATGASRGPSGLVRLTTTVAFGHEVIVPLLPLLRDTLPDVHLELHLSDAPVDLVGAGIDLALRLAPAPQGDFISRKVIDTRYRVVAAPTVPRPAVPDELQRMDCLRFTLPDYRTAWRFRREGTETRVPVDGPVMISNALALREAARAGLGPALLADWMIADDLACGRLVDLFPEHEVTATTFETGVWVLYPSRDYLPARVRAVIDTLCVNLLEINC